MYDIVTAPPYEKSWPHLMVANGAWDLLQLSGGYVAVEKHGESSHPHQVDEEHML